MAPSSPHPRLVERGLLAILAFAVCASAWALKADRSQPINVNADHQEATLGDNGKVTLTGHVAISQGSLVIHGDKAVGYENSAGEWDHAVVTGSPATFQQKLDSGSMVNGSGATIDYRVAENTVVLTGNATVVQQGRGQFHGAKLTYNTDSGRMVGEGGVGGQVHMIFQPKAVAGATQPRPTAPAASATPPSSALPPPATSGQP